MNIYLNGKKIPINPSQSIGKGGEADIYDIGGGQVVKIFKQPNHPDYQNFPDQQQAARERIAEHQQKLRYFPSNLPSHVIQPQGLVTDAKGKNILGYIMPLVKDAEVLLKYSNSNFRQAGISQQAIVEIFQNLHTTVTAIHQAGVIIGDFNDLNVLVKNTVAYLIDADSFQFGGFFCKVFTARFVDPLLCDRQISKPVLNQTYNYNSDWYAFAVMLMQCLLFVEPYGGVYKPKDPNKRIPHDARSLHRITVFHPEVKYPKPAIPYQVLPDDLLNYFQQVFEQDLRGEFPRKILDNLQWMNCPNCGKEHARNICPYCFGIIYKIPIQTVRGMVTATEIFITNGVILYATIQLGKLQWIYHEDGEFRREDRWIFLTGNLDSQLKFRIRGKSTLIGKQGQLLTFTPGKEIDRLAVENFDANAYSRYWTYGGQLLRDGQLGSEYIGDVLANQTYFWVGESFGFGFYRAGNLNIAFVFDSQKKGINDRVKIPFPPGQIIDTNCIFTSDRCWFFWSTQAQGIDINCCIVIRSNGNIEASCQTQAGDNSWLSNIYGKCAVGNLLLVATDEGITRVEINNGKIIQTKDFPDTEMFVNANSQLFPGKQGLYVVNSREILLLKIT